MWNLDCVQQVCEISEKNSTLLSSDSLFEILLLDTLNLFGQLSKGAM